MIYATLDPTIYKRKISLQPAHCLSLTDAFYEHIPGCGILIYEMRLKLYASHP